MRSKKSLDKIIDQAVSASFDKGKINSQVVSRFTKNFREMSLAESIYSLTGFAKGLKRQMAEYTLLVESAVPLSSSDLAKIKHKLTSHFTITSIEVKINPSILGGIKVTIGDNVFDLSIKNRINQLKEALVS